MLRSVVYHTKPWAETPSYIGLPGELAVDTTTGIIYMHDGITPGGTPINAGLKATQIIAALAFVPLSNALLGQPNGIAQLDADAVIVERQIPNGVNTDSLNTTDTIMDGGFF